MIRIVIVDDDPTVLHGLRMRLGLTKDIRVIGEAEDGDTALPIISSLAPDVAVLDVELPGCDGITLARNLRDQGTRTEVVILSMHDDPDTRERAHAAGARFVGKLEGGTALLQAIREAAKEREAHSAGPNASMGEADGMLTQANARGSGLKPVGRSMHNFYKEYYAAVETSSAHKAFCEYAYGRNLCQHGFATMEQLSKLIQVSELATGNRVLDLGCGNGMIAEYISDATGAHVTGLDIEPCAISHANERTFAKRNRLEFFLGDLTRTGLPSSSFDTLLSIDSIYFSDDYAETTRGWLALVRKGGQLAIYLSHGVDPERPRETFDSETLMPDKTPVAVALKQSGLDYDTFDFTPHDYALAQRKKRILAELKPQFEREGNSFLYENRLAETLGVISAIESGMHARYLYHVRVG